VLRFAAGLCLAGYDPKGRSKEACWSSSPPAIEGDPHACLES
jgi:hypothetical protein